MRSKSIAFVFERSGGVVVGGAVVGRGELEGWGAELGRRGEGSILFEDLGLGGEAGVEYESEGDMYESSDYVTDASRLMNYTRVL